MISYRQLLTRFAHTERFAAETLICTILGNNRAWLLAHRETPVAADMLAQLQVKLHRLAGGEPLAYVLGQVYFYGLALTITPDVLIPRPETEQVVTSAFDLAMPATARILDLGCGSGAISCALARGQPHWNIDATDISHAALQVTAANAARLQLAHQIRCLYGDWWQAIAAAQYQLVVSNPPYVVRGDPALAKQVSDHEPALALYAEDQGFAAYTQLFNGMQYHAPGGYLIVEHGYNQQKRLVQMAQNHGLEIVRRLQDTAGIARVLVLRHAVQYSK